MGGSIGFQLTHNGIVLGHHKVHIAAHHVVGTDGPRRVMGGGCDIHVVLICSTHGAVIVHDGTQDGGIGLTGRLFCCFIGHRAVGIHVRFDLIIRFNLHNKPGAVKAQRGAGVLGIVEVLQLILVLILIEACTTRGR